jgi:iron complex transport system substrate-binding protein
MPQRRALFARKSVAISPKESRGAFLLRGKVVRQGSFVKQTTHARWMLAACAALVPCSFGVSGLRAQAPPVAAAATPEFRELTDEAGRTVRIPQPVRRIVSLAPNLTETIYALGLQDRLVGDTDYCDYPADAQKKHKVGGGINPSIEEIAALRPDLVLMTKSYNRLDTVHSLEILGIPSYATDPHTVEQILASTEKLADLLGVPETGAALKNDLQRRLTELQQRLASLPPKRVLFVVWTQPLMSVGKDTFLADALRHAGAASIVDSTQSWPQVNLEEVVKLQPEFLVFADSHSLSGEKELETLAELPGWRVLDAVKNHHLAMISDAVNRPAPRIVSAIEDLARQLHPEAFVGKPDNSKAKDEKKNSPQTISSLYRFSQEFTCDGFVFTGELACAR